MTKTAVTAALCVSLLLTGTLSATGVSAGSANVQSFSYGKSGKGQNLICYKITPPNQSRRKILLNFEIHGWEDEYARDGQVLCNFAKDLISYYSSHENELRNCTLYVIPSSNPDGLRYGHTNNGPGRCQISLGIDLNRSFNYDFKVCKSARNKTLSRPELAPEAKSLANLVRSLRPDVVIDFHGWESKTIGNKSLASIFDNEFSVPYVHNWSSGTHGFFAAWATNYSARTLLVEYPKCAAYRSKAAYSRHTINAINTLLSSYNQESAVMYLDNPRPGFQLQGGSNHVMVSGWALASSGVKNIGIYLDGVYRGSAKTGSYRPDVARFHPEFKNASHSGYSTYININADTLKKGTHELEVRVTSNEGTIMRAESRIRCSQESAVMYLDDPRPDFKLKGGTNHVTVRGWALASSGVKNIGIYLDGVYRGAAKTGSYRPDVARFHPEFKNASHSGYCTNIDINAGTLKKGAHELEVRVTSNEGTIIRAEHRILY